MEKDIRTNAEMFDRIAGSYDFLNHLLSLNIDRSWRRKAINELKVLKPNRILDVATGTADLAIAALNLDPVHITGVDVSPGMLEIGRKKIDRLGLTDKIELIRSPGENLPFPDDSFDAAMVAFGVRNFDDPAKGLSEILRTLRPGGKLVVLEFTLPDKKWMLDLYRFYFHRILPVIGKLFSKDFDAYRYLPRSVETFAKGSEFLFLMDQSGFDLTTFKSLTFGICGLYTGIKKTAINTNFLL